MVVQLYYSIFSKDVINIVLWLNIFFMKILFPPSKIVSSVFKLRTLFFSTTTTAQIVWNTNEVGANLTAKKNKRIKNHTVIGFQKELYKNHKVNGIDHNIYLVDVMDHKRKMEFRFLLGFWFIAFTLFWVWWFQTSHIVGITRFLINTLVVAWSVLMPIYFFFFISRMKKPNPNLVIPKKLRVAMIVTKAPSEPADLVLKTIKGMIAQHYPHDTWLADEQPSIFITEWCATNDVKLSTRYKVEGYHNKKWPRREKCKEGNLAYFYDKYGYENYDIVVQLDADHVPSKNYIEEMIRPFADPAVGYVSAPSLCTSNMEQSWTARGRVYSEANTQGPLQVGYTNGFAPLCIGSHYAVRTKALKEIGGLGPELAEDHSTTYLMNAHGWKGVHAYDSEAFGDGPATFSDFITQEYQWAKSVTRIMLTLTPKFFNRLNRKLKITFLFAQLWYTTLGTTLFIGIFIPPIAILTNTPWVNMLYFEFLFFNTLLVFSMFLIMYWLKKNNWLRPKNSKILSWEIVFFQLARWPYVLLGIVAAVYEVVSGKESHFKVTPKGESVTGNLPIKILLPYVVIVLISTLPALFSTGISKAPGYYYFSILNGLVYCTLILLIVYRQMLENKKYLNIEKNVI